MANYLAFDLGAESGRAMVGCLQSGVLDLEEIYRFPNEPLRQDASLRWDLPGLWREMQRGLAAAAARTGRIASIGVDTWGCDYGLLDEAGALVSNPYHYRDARTDGVMDRVFERVARSRIYDITGIQFLPFNTIYQLVAAAERTPGELAAAKAFGTIPDILNCWLTGVLRAEFTNATTTQMVDARSRQWAEPLLRELDLPVELLPPLVEPGTVIGPLKASVCPELAGTPVVAPACHDTGSAVAAVPASRTRAFLSSGTWSLLGVEVPRPVITAPALAANFTNEGGVAARRGCSRTSAGCGCCRRAGAAGRAMGATSRYPELMAAAADEPCEFLSLFDPDDPRFLHPPDMASCDRGLLPRHRAARARRAGIVRPRNPGEPRVQVPGRARYARGAHGRRHHGDPDHRRRIAEPAAEPVHRRCDGPHGHRRAGRSDGPRKHRHADGCDRCRWIDCRGAADDRALISGRTFRACRCGSVGGSLSSFQGLRGAA